MYYSDYHIHSNISFDGNFEMEDIIKESIKKGLKEIVFTEHLDYREDKYILPVPDFEEYFKKYEILKEKYKKDIIIKKGLELGLQPELKDTIQNKIKNYEFDFIIGSTHIINTIDFVDTVYFANKTKYESYNEYFEEILESIECFDNFDVYGHLDFIKRYGIYGDNNIEYDKHEIIIKKILQALIDKGKGIEINTSGYKYKLNCFHPSYEILKMYKKLGGEIITIGSDAHHLIHIADHFDKPYQILQELGYKYFTIYDKRKPVFKKLNEFIIE